MITLAKIQELLRKTEDYYRTELDTERAALYAEAWERLAEVEAELELVSRERDIYRREHAQLTVSSHRLLSEMAAGCWIDSCKTPPEGDRLVLTQASTRPFGLYYDAPWFTVASTAMVRVNPIKYFRWAELHSWRAEGQPEGEEKAEEK